MKINQVKLLTILLRHRTSAASAPTDSSQTPTFNYSISDIPELVELLNEADRILRSIEVDSLTSDAQMAAALSEADIMLRLAEAEPTLSDAQLVASLDAIDRMLQSLDAEQGPVHLPDILQPDVLPSFSGPEPKPEPKPEPQSYQEPEPPQVTSVAPESPAHPVQPIHPTQPTQPTQPTPQPAAAPDRSSLLLVTTPPANTASPRFEATADVNHDIDYAAGYDASYEADCGVNYADISETTLTGRSDNRSFGIPRQVGIAAGVTIAVTAGAVGQVANRVPEYEGTFQLVVQSQVAQDGAVATPQIEDENQRITDTQVRILESPRLLDPVLEQLQEKHPNVDFRSFTDKLDITVKGDRQLEVRYRDTDSQRVQLVLEQLAQTYVEYNNESCRDSACQGLKFVEAQIPQVQQRVSGLRDKIQQFHQQHGLKNLEAQVRLFSARSTEITKQEAELSGRLNKARQEYEELQMRMALQPDEAIAQAILDRDAQYQTRLKQFRELDRQIVVALSSYQAEDAALQSLREQHQTVSAQLSQEVAQALTRYISNPTSNLQDPVFQEPELLKLLQYSIGTAHQITLIEMRQQTIAEAQQTIAQRKHDLATVLRQYGDLRQQLQAETQILQQYFDKREVLQSQVQQHNVAWQLVAPPELITNQAGEPVRNYLYDLDKDLGSAAVFGALLGLAIAVVTKEKQNRPYPNFTVAQ